MISFNIILLFALFSVCAGNQIRIHIPQTTTIINDTKNYTHHNQEMTWMKAMNVYAFTVKDINGNNVSMSIYRNKILLIVNVASKNKLTEFNYKLFRKLHKKFHNKGLAILAFPCNQFQNEEPGTNAEIAKFSKKKGLKFPIFSKIDVNGDSAHPLWKYLKLMTNNNEDIKSSFTKFIVDRNGQVVRRISTVSVMKVQKVVNAYFRKDVLQSVTTDTQTIVQPIF